MHLRKVGERTYVVRGENTAYVFFDLLSALRFVYSAKPIYR